jgi:ATP-dependent Clp protease adaptor protein ClpS
LCFSSKAIFLDKGDFMTKPAEELESQIKEETNIEEPGLYKVIMHNDDYTTVDFVILVLENIFHKQREEATQIMLNVHQKGMGVAGIFPYDVAETKVLQVHVLAQQHQFPLKCSIEEA